MNKIAFANLANLRISIHTNKVCLQNYTIQIQIQNTQLPVCGTRFHQNKYIVIGYMIGVLLLKNIQLRMLSVSCIISKMYNCYSTFQSGFRISFTSCYAAFHNQAHFCIETIKNILENNYSIIKEIQYSDYQVKTIIN